MVKPITIKGVTYPSQRCAAKALGVSFAAISNAAKRGRLDSVGSGKRKKGCEPTYVKPITIGGVHYPSHKAAAEALGLSSSQISGYIAVLTALNEVTRDV